MSSTEFEMVPSEYEDRHVWSHSPEPERPVSKWTIGWFTPTMIVIGFIAAFATASVHYCLFWWLHRRLVQRSFPQSWVTIVSNALGRVFSLSLGISVGMSYTQTLWSKLRRRSAKVGTIDKMFSMQTNPIKLASISVIKTAPLLWLAAAFLPTIPIAAVFPPGAITVVAEPDPIPQFGLVPTYDFDYRGDNDSWSNLARHALFMIGFETGHFQSPKPYLNQVAKATMMSGSYLTSPSPCGSNCTYEITIPGPEFECKDSDYADLNKLVQDKYGNSSYEAMDVQFLASMQDRGESDETHTKMVFDVEWSSTYVYRGHGMDAYPNNNKHICCTAWYSNYTLMMNYTGGLQETTVKVKRGHVLNWLYSAIFHYEGDEHSYRTNIPGNKTTWSGQSVSTVYRESNVRAVLLSVTDALSGAVSGFGHDNSENFAVANTIAMETPLASFNQTGSMLVKFDIDANVMQGLLQNTTISLLSMSNKMTLAEITDTSYRIRYSFAHPYKLILPYTLSLVGAFIFIVLGIHSLVQNGVAASSGGFLQLLCTTKGSQEIDDMVRGAGLGGDENVKDEMKKLVVKYGEISDSKGLRAGFGLEGEVKDLVKGRNYG